MSSLTIASVTFFCCFGAALLGMVLHLNIPDHHLDIDSKDVVKLVMGLIATMAALVLGLLIASAKSSFDTQTGNLRQLAADIIQLDQILVHYGPEANETRDLLRQAVAIAHDRIWAPEGLQRENLDPLRLAQQSETVFGHARDLSPTTDAQRADKNAALQIASEIYRTRLLMFEETSSKVSWPFLAVLVFWVSVLFLGFGLFPRFNATVTVALFIGAFSVSGAIFLIMELNQPYGGLMQISDTPLRDALARIDR
jgi:hypothetical protein